MQSDQPKIAVDPNLATEQAQAQKTLIDNLQAQAGADTASLMTRYGTRLALGGTGTPAAAPLGGAV
jgi:hypothetical protein